MKYLSFVIILGLVSVAVLGAFAMNHSSSHEHGGCIAATAQSSDCAGSNLLDSAIFHIRALQNFSLAILTIALLGIFGSLALSAASAFISPPHPALGFSRHQDLKPPTQLALSHWLSLHEHSPTL